MKTEQSLWTQAGGWNHGNFGGLGRSASLVLAFGSTAALKDGALLRDVRTAYPAATILGCSTAGEICGEQVYDDSLVASAVAFDCTEVRGGRISIRDAEDSYDAGKTLATSLPTEGLAHAFVISDGLAVNGSELVRGLVDHLPQGVTVTGGLSADGDRFQETLVVWDGEARRDSVAILGFYGDSFRVGYASLGGWDPFGPERLITKSTANVLYELDGRSALELYKTYLGEHASGLPATGLLFPLSLRVNGDDTPVVRTILSVDDDVQSMTFAGDVPEGAYARLMKANFDRLIDGAVGAARNSVEAVGSASPDLAILISCVGRKMVLKQRVEEEVEGVRQVVGDRTMLTGFYSYGEISPFTPSARCELHNQTMTITTISEA
jgi:hypothetical protein